MINKDNIKKYAMITALSVLLASSATIVINEDVVYNKDEIEVSPIKVISANDEVKYVAPVGYVVTKNDEGEMICVKYNDQNEERSR